jgi:hypothetical protein
MVGALFQLGTSKERTWAVDADQLQRQRTRGHACRHQRHIDRDRAAAAFLVDHEVDPDLAHHPRHAAHHAHQERQPEPQRQARRVGEGHRQHRARRQRAAHQPHRAQPCGKGGNAMGRRDHADAPHGFDETDGDGVDAAMLERQRHQRHRGPRLHAVAQTRQIDRQQRRPLHAALRRQEITAASVAAR